MAVAVGEDTALQAVKEAQAVEEWLERRGKTARSIGMAVTGKTAKLVAKAALAALGELVGMRRQVATPATGAKLFCKQQRQLFWSLLRLMRVQGFQGKPAFVVLADAAAKEDTAE